MSDITLQGEPTGGYEDDGLFAGLLEEIGREEAEEAARVPGNGKANGHGVAVVNRSVEDDDLAEDLLRYEEAVAFFSEVEAGDPVQQARTTSEAVKLALEDSPPLELQERITKVARILLAKALYGAATVMVDPNTESWMADAALKGLCKSLKSYIQTTDFKREKGGS